VDGVGENAVRPVVHQGVPGGVFRVAGELEGEQRGDLGLVVRPPEFHLGPVFLHGPAVQIGEVEQAAVLPIPAARPHAVEDAESELEQARVAAAMLGLVQDEPRAFDGVAGIERAAVEVIEHRAVGADDLHEGAEVGLVEIALDGGERAVDPLGAGGAPHGDVAQQGADLLGRDDGDHVRGHALHGPRGRIGLRRHHAGREAVVQVGVEILRRLGGGAGVAGGLGIGRAADGGEALAVDIAPHPQRPAVAGDGEVEFAAGPAAMAADEIEAVLRGREPLGPRLSTVLYSVAKVHAARPCSQTALSVSMTVPSSPRPESSPPCSRSSPCRSQNGTTLLSRPSR
jgi:hypothetical protein